MAKRWKVVVTDDRFSGYDEERELLPDSELVMPSADGLAAACSDADAVLVNLAPLGGDLIRGMRKCRVISRYGIGYDNVDVRAATEMGIWVANVPGYCDEEVAEHALALMFDAARRISQGDRELRSGLWRPGSGRRTLAGSTLGILGFGGIAKALLAKAAGLGFERILVWSPSVTDAKIEAFIGERGLRGGAEVRAAEFDALLSASDFLSLHLSLKPETAGILDASAFGRMKDGAVLVNTARGALVDEAALAAALESGKLSGAGLDVFAREPLRSDDRLRDLPGVTLSPHAAFYSPRATSSMKRRAAMNLRAVLDGGKPLWPINEPSRS